MKKILGAFLFAIAFLGALFFRNYQGSVIPYPTLWYILSIGIGIVGVWLVVSSVRGKILLGQQQQTETFELKKRNYREIEVEFDKCEFKTGSYSREVEDHTGAAGLLIPGPLAANRGAKTEFIVSTYVVYTDVSDGNTFRYVSHTFPLEIVALKMLVMDKKLFLYVDRADKKKYFFEMRA